LLDALSAADQDIFADARILVVDDVDANVILLRRILSSVGVTNAVGVTDPAEAIDIYPAFAPDLVLLDLHMPGMDGIELLLRLHGETPDDNFVPIVMLTADINPESRKRALAQGANDFLTKPFDATEVLLRVRNLLVTRALYLRVREHNEVLRRNLERQQERQLRAERLGRYKSERLRGVLQRDALSMAYQPIADLRNGAVVGCEALARFADPPYRPPNEWFAEADEVGMGPEFELVAVGLGIAGFSFLESTMFLSLNVSPLVAISDAFFESVRAAPLDRVVVELTEHTRIEDYEASMPAFERLRSSGIRIAVDDAGAGYAGLQHILRLRPDIVKLDQGLTGGIDTDAAKRALVGSLVSFALEIGAVLVAEGIETPQQLSVLRDLGVPWGQGYFLGRPQSMARPATSSIRQG
jgi:EAL domain-containing protein (putative c-di-GMP-specific phosphodiesterase class I)/CheY-like chemotaxis protein